MACCSGSGGTPLGRYARELADKQHIEDALPFFFPMYTVSLEVLLEMVDVKAHEELLAEGSLVNFDETKGKVSKAHPDPDCRQLRILQDALKRIISTNDDYIPKDLVTEAFVPKAKGISTRDFRRKALFLWYDYFSCPQLETFVKQPGSPRISPRISDDPMESVVRCQTTTSRLGRAVDSIPAYIARCSFFFVLCPVIESMDGSSILGPSSWAERGWCRVERTIRELSEQESYILIKSSTNLETVATPMTSFGGSPGEGSFTLRQDHEKLCPILKLALRRKLFYLLQTQNIPGYRALLNLQSVHLRGFNTEVLSVVPGFQESDIPGADLLPRFFFENGFKAVNQVDGVGWNPLHYAAMNGDPLLIQGLLENRANLNAKTKKQNPYSGIAPFTTALSISLFFKNHAATRLLLSAGSSTSSGLITPLDIASMAGNAEGIRQLFSSAKIRDKSLGFALGMKSGIFAFSAFEIACTFGSLDTAEMLLRQEPDTDISRGLHMAMVFRGGTAAFVNLLVHSQADVNKQWKEPFFTFHGIYNHIQALKYKMGQRTISNMLAYHMNGSTPLMCAVVSGQYEGAAALIAAGARLDIRNERNRCAADFIRQLSTPKFLMEVLDGNPRSAQACRRIADVATSDNVIEI